MPAHGKAGLDVDQHAISPLGGFSGQSHRRHVPASGGTVPLGRIRHTRPRVRSILLGAELKHPNRADQILDRQPEQPRFRWQEIEPRLPQVGLAREVVGLGWLGNRAGAADPQLDWAEPLGRLRLDRRYLPVRLGLEVA